MAEAEFGAWLANELVAMLESMLAQTDLRAVRGHKMVEVKPIWANKGLAADRILALYPGAGFRLAMGDDRTDEDLFARIPDGWTVRVGPRRDPRALYPAGFGGRPASAGRLGAPGRERVTALWPARA